MTFDSGIRKTRMCLRLLEFTPRGFGAGFGPRVVPSEGGKPDPEQRLPPPWLAAFLLSQTTDKRRKKNGKEGRLHGVA